MENLIARRNTQAARNGGKAIRTERRLPNIPTRDRTVLLRATRLLKPCPSLVRCLTQSPLAQGARYRPLNEKSAQLSLEPRSMPTISLIRACFRACQPLTKLDRPR